MLSLFLGIDLIPVIPIGNTLAAMYLMALEVTSGLNASV